MNVLRRLAQADAAAFGEHDLVQELDTGVDRLDRGGRRVGQLGQLEMVLGMLGVPVPRPLAPELLQGLPVPEDVWG